MVRFVQLLGFSVLTMTCSCLVGQGQDYQVRRYQVGKGQAATGNEHRIGFGFASDPSRAYVPNGYFNPYGFDLYTHDPYRFGSFDPPDLLEDPYFRERHRYDSRYPGRYRHRRVIRSSNGFFRPR